MICKNTDEAIQAYLQEQESEILENWFRLIRIPSVQGKAEEHAPFGRACAEALAEAEKMFAEAGFETRSEADRGYALSFWQGGKRTIGLFGHSDVVPVGDGWSFTEPFEPRIVDGCVFGRGSSDDKSGIIATLYAMKFLRDHKIPIQSRLLAYIGSNEESGMKDIEAFVANEEMPDLSLIPDSSFPCALGEAGILHAIYESEEPFVDVIDFHGGEAFNVILEKVQVKLRDKDGLFEEIKARMQDEAVYTLSRENGQLLLQAKGLTKHAAHPDGSLNAAALAAKLLAECPSLAPTDRETMKTIAEYLLPYYGEAMGISYEEEGFGKLSAANGMVKVESGHVSVSLDIRYGVGFAAKELEDRLDGAWAARGWKRCFMNNRPGFKVDPSSPLPETFLSLYREITGRENPLYWMRGGTYARYLKNAMAVGTHTPAEGEVKKPPMPAGHGSAHQPDECVNIRDLMRGIRLLIHYVIAADSVINKA